MKKKIFRSITSLSIFGVLITSVLLCFVFYYQIDMDTKSDLANRVQAFASLTHKTAEKSLSSTIPEDMRVTIVKPDGTVVYDNTVDVSTLPNHSNRKEIKEALKTGTGQVSRVSKTLGKETLYYAVKLSDGYVLRVSRTADTIFKVFQGKLPIIGLIVISMVVICYVGSSRLTKRIIKPINDIDLEHPDGAYDELMPFTRTIASQKEQIEKNIRTLFAKQDAINSIMENMSEGAVLVDKNEDLIYVNKGAKNLFDFETIGEKVDMRELFRDLSLIKITQTALLGTKGSLDKVFEGREFRIFARPVVDTGAILLFVDITEQAEAEKLRREFTANVSHELKTPLTSISGYAELLESGIVKEEDKNDFVHKIKKEADRLTRLVDDIILLSGLDEGADKDDRVDVNLLEVAEEVVSSLEIKAKENHVTLNVLTYDNRDYIDENKLINSSSKIIENSNVYNLQRNNIEGDSSKTENIISLSDSKNSETNKDNINNTIFTIKANYSQMEELFYNLVSNAIKYNKPNGKVDIILSADNDNLQVAVSDNGIGIPDRDKPRVFERFYRVDKSRSKKLGGTGLGLAIVKHIAENYDAELRLESKEGEGTKISVRFP